MATTFAQPTATLQFKRLSASQQASLTSKAAFISKTKRTALLRLASLKKFAPKKSPPVQVFNPTIPSPALKKIFFKPTPRVILKPFVPGTGIVFRPPKALGRAIKQRPGTGIIFKPPRSLVVNIAGNTINESPPGVSNSVFTNRLKNIQLGTKQTNLKTLLIIAAGAAALLFFLSK